MDDILEIVSIFRPASEELNPRCARIDWGSLRVGGRKAEEVMTSAGELGRGSIQISPRLQPSKSSFFNSTPKEPNQTHVIVKYFEACENKNMQLLP